MDMRGQLHTPASLSLEKEPLVPIGKEAREGPRAGLDTVVKRKVPSPYKNPIIQPVAQRYTPELSRPIKHKLEVLLQV
jgi:hypothetical protein